jgi:hypothetical protein
MRSFLEENVLKIFPMVQLLLLLTYFFKYFKTCFINKKNQSDALILEFSVLIFPNIM